MIDRIKNIPITEKSYPVTRAAELCDFSQNGYVEEEYFMSGQARVYEDVDGQTCIKYENAKYVNRFLVRRPKDPNRASGRVIIEILNATSGFDIDRTWVLCKDEWMRSGDFYIGITSKPSSLAPMKKADPERYGELYWSNPNPKKVSAVTIQESKFVGGIRQESEMGLFWDMLIDLYEMIDKAPEFLAGIEPKKVYLAGWSQSCGYIIRYVNSFVNQGLAKNFDGYFVAAGVRSMPIYLNQYDIAKAIDPHGSCIEKVTVPYIMVQTESENAGFNNAATRLEDSDDPELMIRTYEIPGATHDNSYTMVDYFRDTKDLFRTGLMLGYQGEEPYPNNFPYHLAFSAAFVQMRRWAEEGIPPIKTEKICLDFDNRNIRDSFGNAVGGWRLPPIIHPICAYYPSCTPINGARMMLFGSRKPFAKETLIKLYGSLEHYRALIIEAADKCIADGLLLPEDREACIAFCVDDARQFWN